MATTFVLNSPTCMKCGRPSGQCDCQQTPITNEIPKVCGVCRMPPGECVCILRNIRPEPGVEPMLPIEVIAAGVHNRQEGTENQDAARPMLSVEAIAAGAKFPG